MTCYFLLPNLSAGGAERVSITFARLLKRQGVSVVFVDFGNGRGEMTRWIGKEFQIVSLGCKRVMAGISRLTAFIKAHPGGIMFSSREHVSIAGIIASQRTKMPIIVRVPNMPSNVLHRGPGEVKWKVIKLVNRLLLRRARYIIGQSEAMRDELISFYHLPPEKVVAINNPVDKEFVVSSADGAANPYEPGHVHFLTVCNVAYSKGIDILLEAFAIVRKSIPQARLTILGRHNTDYARNIVARVRPEDEVQFLGFKDNPYPYMRYCDVFVLPSRMEGFPNVLLEAMCFDRPAVATTCVPVIRQLITPGQNGFHCEVGDVNALAECMTKAVSLHDINNHYGLFDQQRLLSLFQ